MNSHEFHGDCRVRELTFRLSTEPRAQQGPANGNLKNVGIKGVSLLYPLREFRSTEYSPISQPVDLIEDP